MMFVTRFLPTMIKVLLCLFVATTLLTPAYGQTSWVKDPNNPVLSRGANGEWDDDLVAGLSTIYDGSAYLGWYSGFDGNGTGIGYVTSEDGINWTKHHSNPVMESGASGSWDDFVVYQPSVLFDGTTYHMWFGGHNGPTNRQIGYATSPDAITWTKSASNPVLQPSPSSSWDDEWVDSPNVLLVDGMFHMWYSGSDGLTTQSGHATSLDGLTWQKDSLNPVLKVESGEWDDNMSYQPSVLIDRNSTYHMFYSGGPSFSWSVGYASSSDGVTWTKHRCNPVMEPGPGGSWDDTYTGLFTVAFNADSSEFEMWYTGDNLDSFVGGDIGYASASLELATAIEDVGGFGLPEDFRLLQNYPNPFNPSTTVRYDLPHSATVRLTVADLLGREVALLDSGAKGVGHHEVTFDATGLSSGVYLLRLEAGDVIQIRSLILSK